MQIIVLGMHRSGTSALTGLLSLMGAYVGAQDDMLLPDHDNPKGFFERLDVVMANREIMAANRCDWDQVSRWNPNQPVFPSHSDQLKRIIGQLNQHPIVALKDPRLCLTLPYWLLHMDRPVVMLCARDPRTIVDSLVRRNRMPPDYALALWEYYAVCALRSTAHAHSELSAIVSIDYESLIEDPHMVAAQLAKRIEILNAPSPDQVAEHITPSLNQSHASADILLTPWQKELAAMWRGEIPLRRRLDVSPASLDTLWRLESQFNSASPTA